MSGENAGVVRADVVVGTILYFDNKVSILLCTTSNAATMSVLQLGFEIKNFSNKVCWGLFKIY